MVAAPGQDGTLHLPHPALVDRERPGEAVVAGGELPRRRVELVAGEPGRRVGVECVLAREQRRARDAAIRLSTIDPLTGLFNRTFFFAAVEREIARSARSGRGFCLLMMDLDELKTIPASAFEAVDTQDENPDARLLQVPLAVAGDIDASFEGPAGVLSAREHHGRAREELPVRGLALSRSDPALPTVFVDAS